MNREFHRTWRMQAMATLMLILTSVGQVGAQSGSFVQSPASVLMQLGFDAPALVAGGASSTDVEAMLGFLVEHQDDMNALASLQTALIDARLEEASARQRIGQNGASDTSLDQVGDAESALTTLESHVTDARSALRSVLEEFIVLQLGADGAQIAFRFASNRHRFAPDRFRALNLPASTWATVETAWRKQSSGMDLTSEEAALLLQCESNAVTILVSSRLQTNLAAVSGVFDQALTESQLE